jgi:hypothetical protein
MVKRHQRERVLATERCDRMRQRYAFTDTSLSHPKRSRLALGARGSAYLGRFTVERPRP